MNTDTIHMAESVRGLAMVPTETPSELSDEVLSRFKGKWNPRKVSGFGVAAQQMVVNMMASDHEQYPAKSLPGVHYRGSSMREVYRRLYPNGNPRSSSPVASFGGVNFLRRQKDGVPDSPLRRPEFEPLLRAYREFAFAFSEVRIEFAMERNIRAMIGTGGGPGFAMYEMPYIFRSVAEQKGVYHTNAENYAILANLPDEAPTNVAESDYTVRPQGNLAERCIQLIAPACGALVFPHGLGGKDEVSDGALSGQLFGKPGLMIMGVRLFMLVDCELPAGLVKAVGLPVGTRFFDSFELERRSMIAAGTASQADFGHFLKVSLDGGSTAEAGRAAAEQFNRWEEARIANGVREQEEMAMLAALERS